MTEQQLNSLRERVAEIRRELIARKHSRYKCLGSPNDMRKTMGRLYNPSLTYGQNIAAFYDYFHKRAEGLRYETIRLAEKEFIRRQGLKTIPRLKRMRTIIKSTDQAGVRSCGYVVENIFSFMFKKVGIPNKQGKRNKKNTDITIFSPDNSEWPVNAKNTVRDRMNDNKMRIKIVMGPYRKNSNNYGGFTKAGFLAWISNHKESVLIVVSDFARQQVYDYMKFLLSDKNIGAKDELTTEERSLLLENPKILSFDEGAKAIKMLIGQSPFSLN